MNKKNSKTGRVLLASMAIGLFCVPNVYGRTSVTIRDEYATEYTYEFDDEPEYGYYTSTTYTYPEPWNTKLNNAINESARVESCLKSRSNTPESRESYAVQFYYVWDDLLNEIWQSYPQSTKDRLLSAQLDWIYDKEAKQAQYSYADGMIYAGTRTKDRVYVLLQYV